MAIKVVTGAVITMPTAGVAVPLAAATPLPRATAAVLIQADEDNSGNVYVGDENVTTSNGFLLGPCNAIQYGGEGHRAKQDEVIINDLYVVAKNNGDKVRVQFFTKRAGPNP